jgi:hypothetical protein
MCSRSIIRAVLCANLFLFVLFVIPVTHHWVDQGFRALRAISNDVENVAGRSLQVWLVTSTVIATGLFGVVAWKNRRGGRPVRSLKFEGILLVTWWIIVVGACAYGFMLGMGG